MTEKPRLSQPPSNTNFILRTELTSGMLAEVDSYIWSQVQNGLEGAVVLQSNIHREMWRNMRWELHEKVYDWH